MMRITAAALAAFLAGAAPALAQATDAPEIVAPRTVTIVGAPLVRLVRYRTVARTVLVPQTRIVRRAVLVARTHYVRRVVAVPETVYVARRRVATIPVGPYALGAPLAGYAPVYPGTGLVGPTWVPPGTSYACVLGTVGCDSSVVGR